MDSQDRQVSQADKLAKLPPYWQKEFQKIQELGFAKYKKFNWPAFFFTWIWAFSKGMNRVAIGTLLLIAAATCIGFFVESDSFDRALTAGLTFGLGFAFAQNGNKIYYQKIIENKKY